MKQLLTCFLMIFTLSSCYSFVNNDDWVSIDKLKNCDLLFHISKSSNPITQATTASDEENIDHVAIFFIKNKKKCVVEAIDNGVVITPLNEFLSREGKILVGKLKTKIDRKKTLANALSYIGRNYDFLYLPENDDIYCSELVEFSYITPSGQRIFHPIAMSFHDENGNIIDYWKDFYKAHNMDVPEAFPGSNPSSLSKHKSLKIKKLNYKIDK